MKHSSRILSTIFLTISLIVGFQAYWLFSSYHAEKKLIMREMNFLFKETGFELKFGVPFSHLNGKHHWMDAHKAVRIETVDSTHEDSSTKRIVIIKEHVALPGEQSNVSVNQEELIFNGAPDSISVNNQFSEQVFKLLSADSLQIKFIQKLRDQHLPSNVTIRIETEIDSSEENKFRGFCFPAGGPDDGIAIATVSPSAMFVLQRMIPQFLISIVLVGLTLITLILLYKNMRKSQRMAIQQRQLISNISHELKTPVSTVSVALEALGNFHALNDENKTKEYLEISRQELARLALLTDSVLQISLLESGNLRMQRELFDFAVVVKQVCDVMKLQIESKGGSLDVNIEDGNYTIDSDKLHISGMLFNLIDNAIKYSKVSAEISIHVSSTEKDIKLIVSDKGIGIAPEDQKKIFEKFYRAEKGDTHNVKGYGLGLSYVAEVVRQQGGAVKVESKPGAGSSFIIQLKKENHG